MDIMLRILKYPASGGAIGDIADVYEVEDLTNYKINNTDCLLVVTGTPFDNLKEAKDFYCPDVSVIDPLLLQPETKVIRRNRYSIDWASLGKIKAKVTLNGWAKINSLALSNSRRDHK